MTADESGTRTERLLRRDRWIVGAGLLLISVLCWWYLVAGPGMRMTSWQFPPPATMGGEGIPWDASRWLFMLLMWWIMMIAMMVPSAAPMVMLYAKVYRHGQKAGQTESAVAPTMAFAGGYLVSWLLFSLFATILHFALEQSGLVHWMTMWSTNAALSGSFLLAAGLYQFSPWKNRCLHHCRSPVAFLSAHWRKSRAGALRMGIEHGLYCIGCCWSLMLLLFVGGVMNLIWIAGLAVVVLLEKLHPSGRLIARLAGALMVAAGAYLLLGLVAGPAQAEEARNGEQLPLQACRIDGIEVFARLAHGPARARWPGASGKEAEVETPRTSPRSSFPVTPIR